jgi:hypothetical protein
MAGNLENGSQHFVQVAPKVGGKPFTLHDDAPHRHP